MNETSCLLSWLIVPSLDSHLIRKDICITNMLQNGFTSLVMLMFSKIFFFFLDMWTLLLPFLSFLIFLESSMTRFKLGLAYVLTKNSNNSVDRPLAMEPNPENDLAPPVLCHSTRPTQPLDRYGLSHSFLLTTLSNISIPNTYLQAVRHDSWKQAMKNWTLLSVILNVKP